MAQDPVDIGTGQGLGDGDPAPVAFTKINGDFAEIYANVKGVMVWSDENTQYESLTGTVLRPAFGSVEWRGPVSPFALGLALANDDWVQT